MSKLVHKNTGLKPLNFFSMTQIAYSVTSSAGKFDELLRKELKSTNYEVLVKSTDFAETSDKNLRAVAYVDPESKEVTIAIAGTDFSNSDDVSDDAQLVLGEVPSKIAPMKAFIAKVMSELGDPSAYTFNVTGHSLGATVAQLASLHLIAQGQKVANCSTFDNPGAVKAFAYAVEKHHLEYVPAEKIAETKFVSVQSRPNIVNTLDEPFGERYVIILPKTEAVAKTKVTSENIGYLAYTQDLLARVGKAAVESFTSNAGYLEKLFSDMDYRDEQATKAAKIFEVVKSEVGKKVQDVAEIIKTTDATELYIKIGALLQELTRNIELVSVSNEHSLGAGWREALESDHIYKVKSGYNFKTDRSVVVEASEEELVEMQKHQAEKTTTEKQNESWALKFYNTIKLIFGFHSDSEIKFESEGNTVAFKVIDHLKDVLAGVKKAGSEVLEAAAVACDIDASCSTGCEPMLATACSIEVKELAGLDYDFAHNAAAAAA